jgi:hypothetical protein
MKILYVFCILFLCISCDIDHSYSRTVINNSSYDIWLINDRCFEDDSILIVSNSSQIISFNWTYGGYKRIFTSCRDNCLDSLNSRIDSHDSLSLTMPVEIETNWENEIGNYYCWCKYTFDDSGIN